MTIGFNIAKHMRELYFGGNWTDVSFKPGVADISWQQAVTKVGSLNTIAALVYHTGYYVTGALNVLRDRPLVSGDESAFDVPTIESQADWEKLLARIWRDAEDLAALVEQLPDARFAETFADDKLGTYYRNLHGIIEHTHYHLGQIVLLKKLLSSGAASPHSSPSQSTS